MGGQPSDVLGFDATQALWLTPTARLDVAGTAELQNDAAGRPVGTVLGGGSISLNAQRGYVVAEAGAVLDLRGHAARAMTAADAVPAWVSLPWQLEPEHARRLSLRGRSACDGRRRRQPAGQPVAQQP